MKIALFSYEYPPDTAHGGVATCTYQTAMMMACRGHHVEVFVGSETRSITEHVNGITVHRLRHPDHGSFHQAIGPVFTERHRTIRFDVIETPELEAEARDAMAQAPDVARVVKLHCPNLYLRQATHGRYNPPALFERARLHFDAWRQGHKPYWAGSRRPAPASPQSLHLEQLEHELAKQADVVITPSQHLGQRIITDWGIERSRIRHVPNVFCPGHAMLSLPIQTRTRRVTYIGRLEPLKGIFDLARAIPIIRRRFPDARFRLIGESQASDIFGDLRHYLDQTLLRRERDRVELIGEVPAERIPNYLGESDVCVLPSILDNFPYACLEAMAAGRAVVGTLGTGMQEMIDHDQTGRLVPMFNPHAIADAVVDLLQNDQRRWAIGQSARQHVIDTYNTTSLGPLHEQAYALAIMQRDKRLMLVNHGAGPDA